MSQGSTDPPVREASCSCGQLTVQVHGDPIMAGVCHCQECQRRTGSVFGFQALYPRDRVRISGRASEYRRVNDHGEARTFHFCPECGGTAFYDVEPVSDAVMIPVGAFAEPDFPVPQFSMYDSRRHAWTTVPGDVYAEKIPPADVMAYLSG